MIVVKQGVLIMLVMSAVPSAQDRVNFSGKTALFGTLHAHSSLSGDVGEDHGLLPLEAYEYAMNAGLDFLGISDHHKPPDAPGGNKYHLSSNAYGSLVSAATQFTAAHSGEFVAIPGIEWGTIGTGNHVNIFGSTQLPPDHIDDDDYDELYEWINENALFAQFNHPYSWGKKSTRDKSVGNYGRELFESAEAFASAANSKVQLMSIICTVGGGHIGGLHADSEALTHRDARSDAFRIYRQHLNDGLSLSPSANQDTHGTNPGTVTAARTGVWVDEVTLSGVSEAINGNRVFATEDDELAVAFQVRYRGKTYWMGETVPLVNEEEVLEFVIHIGQEGAGSGTSESADSPYQITVFSDSDGVGGRLASEWDTWAQAQAGTRSFELPVVAGEYLFLEISELEGKDNPIGDGDDEVGVDGGIGGDGLRDDLNDTAWTSPIWFSWASEESGFVWSSNSEMYHDSDCWVVGRIGAANRRESGAAPSGFRKHDCSM